MIKSCSSKKNKILWILLKFTIFVARKKISKNCNKRTVNQWQRYKRLEQEQDYW
jgi:hypothetical protein